MVFAWFSTKVEKRLSDVEGRGVFAICDIKMGETVLIKGGHIMTRQQRDHVAKTLGPAEIQIGEDLFIGPIQTSERDSAMMYLNHSCDPNVGIQGQIVFCAMRDISKGEEIAFDYATGDDDDWTLECNCGAENCRGIVSGQDWRIPQLQQKYAGWFSLFLQNKISGI